MLSALILAFLGVPDETIVEDYALSGPAMERLLEQIKAEYPDSVEEVERYAPAMLQVLPETMEEFLASLRTEYGSYDAARPTPLGSPTRWPPCAAPSWSRSDRPGSGGEAVRQ